MNTLNRQVLRLANQIRQQLLLFRAQEPMNIRGVLNSLTEQAQELSLIQHRLNLCQRYGLEQASRSVLRRLSGLLEDLPYGIGQLKNLLPKEDSPNVLSLGELVQEFEQIEQEFGDWLYKPDAHQLCVSTDSIALEGIALGRFEIQLDLSNVSQPRRHPPYLVVAMDPNPPSCNSSVTHPHVSDDRLCEGDASEAIRMALIEGRICDFFLLVRSVLQTYNPESPYVSLEHWYGSSCYECGNSMDSDESSYCEHCDHEFCSDCMGICRSCDCSYCLGCLSDCPLCEESTCSDCLKPCKQCGKRVCASCREDEICTDCQEEMENSHDDDQPESPAAGSSEPNQSPSHQAA